MDIDRRVTASSPALARLAQSPVCILLAIWGLYVAVLAALQLLRAGYGFKVWPIGEDLNWVNFFQDGSGASVAKQLWAVDGRNPLSPWWYVAAEPIIRASPYGLHIVSQLVYPIMAVGAFLLLDQLGRGKATLFAFCVAVIVLVWTFTGRFDHIQWNMFGAVACTVLSIFFYCRYVDRGRSNSRDIVLALLLYLVAVATYTLQSGAVIAVVAIGLLRGDGTLRQRVRSAAFDASAFLVLFVVFCLIWTTASPMTPSNLFLPDRSSILTQIYLSIRRFIWPETFRVHLQDVRDSWSTLKTAVIFIAALAVLGTSLKYAYGKVKGYPSAALFGWVAVVLVAIAAPTFIVEVTNTTWPPGTRSIMVQPVFQPLLFVSIIFLGAMVMGARRAAAVATIGTAALGAWVMVFALAYNHRQVLLTRNQMGLAAELRKIQVPPDKPMTFVVKFADYYQPYIATEPNWPPAMKIYGRAVFGRPDVQVLAIRYGNPNEAIYGCQLSTVEFTDDGADVAGRHMPADQMTVVLYDDKHAKVLPVVTPGDFKNLCVRWKAKSQALKIGPVASAVPVS